MLNIGIFILRSSFGEKFNEVNNVNYAYQYMVTYKKVLKFSLYLLAIPYISYNKLFLLLSNLSSNLFHTISTYSHIISLALPSNAYLEFEG